MKKKYLALVLAACMTASLAACGSTAADTSAPAATTEEAADTAAAESTEAADTAAATGEHGPSSEAAPAWEDYDARIAAIRSETDLVKREALMHKEIKWQSSGLPGMHRQQWSSARDPVCRAQMQSEDPGCW